MLERHRRTKSALSLSRLSTFTGSRADKNSDRLSPNLNPQAQNHSASVSPTASQSSSTLPPPSPVLPDVKSASSSFRSTASKLHKRAAPSVSAVMSPTSNQSLSPPGVLSSP